MKKNLCILLLVFLIIPMLANADNFDFSYRNNIAFGDDIDTMMAKEGGSGQLYEGGDEVTYDNVLVFNRITLSSIAESSLNYFFNDGKLNGIIIIYRGMNDDIDTYKLDQQMITDGLIRKYGKPTHNIEKEISIYPRGAYNDYRNIGGVLADMAKTIISIEQWEIDIDDDKVLVIEHVLGSYSGLYHSHLLSYECIEKNESIADYVDTDL